MVKPRAVVERTMRPWRSIHDLVASPPYSSLTSQARTVSRCAATQRWAAESRRALSATTSVLSARIRTATSRSSWTIGSKTRSAYDWPGASCRPKVSCSGSMDVMTTGWSRRTRVVCGRGVPASIAMDSALSPCTVPAAWNAVPGAVRVASNVRRRRSRVSWISVASSVRCTFPSTSMSSTIRSRTRSPAGRVSTVLDAYPTGPPPMVMA